MVLLLFEKDQSPDNFLALRERCFKKRANQFKTSNRMPQYQLALNSLRKYLLQDERLTPK